VNNGPIIFMPWLAKIFPKMSGWTAVVDGVKHVKDFIKDTIAEHKGTRDPDNARDYMDVYLNEIEKTTDNDSSFYKNAGGRLVKNIVSRCLNSIFETRAKHDCWDVQFIRCRRRNDVVNSQLGTVLFSKESRDPEKAAT
jgi:hypothetical protein